MDEKGEERLGGVPVITAEGEREVSGGALYSEEPPKTEAAPLRAVPYYAWGNRGGGEMRVWIRE